MHARQICADGDGSVGAPSAPVVGAGRSSSRLVASATVPASWVGWSVAERMMADPEMILLPIAASIIGRAYVAP